jgi:hypothetical protein
MRYDTYSFVHLIAGLFGHLAASYWLIHPLIVCIAALPAFGVAFYGIRSQGKSSALPNAQRK